MVNNKRMNKIPISYDKLFSLVTESLNSDAREFEVAKIIDNWLKKNKSSLRAKRPDVSPHYADVAIIDPNKGDRGWFAWVEVKMNLTDNLANSRIKYDGTKWFSNGVSQMFCDDFLNQGGKYYKEAQNFIKMLAKILGKKPKDIKLSDSAMPGKLTQEEILKVQDYLYKNNLTKNIIPDKEVDATKYVSYHYAYDKGVPGDITPVAYIQLGDNFLRFPKDYLGKNFDPLKFGNSVPILSINGHLAIRLSVRSQKYEILPTLKAYSITQGGLNADSNYSFAPGSSKDYPPFKLNI